VAKEERAILTAHPNREPKASVILRNVDDPEVRVQTSYTNNRQLEEAMVVLREVLDQYGVGEEKKLNVALISFYKAATEDLKMMVTLFVQENNIRFKIQVATVDSY
jgi:hypothetical protein